MADKREEEIKEVVFGRKEIDPEQQKQYLEKIAAAKKGGLSKLKGNTPIGHVERPTMPDLTSRSGSISELPTGLTPEGGVAPRPPGSPLLSAQTQAQLSQALAAQQQAEAPKAAEAPTKDLDEIFDSFDFNARGEAERVLNNKRRRAEIEARCSPMRFEDLLVFDEVHQIVPIIPDKFVVTFRSIKPDESLFVKEYMTTSEAKSPQYAGEKYDMCLLTCALLKINDLEFPSHLDKNGDPDLNLFEAKLRKVMKKSGYIVADLGINYAWFDIRVRKLIAGGELGNG